jgi:hypothetical protein
MKKKKRLQGLQRAIVKGIKKPGAIRAMYLFTLF